MLESKLKEEEYMLIKAKCKLINTQSLWCTMRDRMISWRMASYGDRRQGCVVQLRDDQYEDILCLKLGTRYEDCGKVKICRRVFLPYWCMGEFWRSLHQACASKHDQERCSNLRESTSSSSRSSGMLKAKV